MQKLMIPIQGDFVAPRFDLVTEVLIAQHDDGTLLGEPKTIIMERASDEDLCQMIVEEHITEMVCGGIDETHYSFLTWKKIKVVDGIVGDWQSALEKTLAGTIKQDTVLYSEKERLSAL